MVCPAAFGIAASRRPASLRHGEDAAGDIGRHHPASKSASGVSIAMEESAMPGIVDERVEGCVERVETGLDGGFVGDVEGDGARLECRAANASSATKAVEFSPFAPRAHRDPGRRGGRRAWRNARRARMNAPVIRNMFFGHPAAEDPSLPPRIRCF